MHVTKTGKQSTSRRENVARGIHDTCILNAMQAFLHDYDQVQVVGVMGGHAMLRTDAAYHQTVMISKKLTENGFLMISGGGPGAMEATHLGSWMAGRTDEEVEDALKILAPAPDFKSPGWLSTAFDVISKYPQSNYKSLSIPTWYYGHEPPTIFATHIAKFFNNSIREDTILTEDSSTCQVVPARCRRSSRKPFKIITFRWDMQVRWFLSAENIGQRLYLSGPSYNI